MGLIDRLKSVGRVLSGSGAGAADGAGQAALQLLEEGLVFEQSGQPSAALERYDAALRLAPHLGRAHFNRGNILLEQGDAEAAWAAFEKALESNPNSAGAHYNLGNTGLRLGRLEAALAAYRRAIDLRPEFVDAEIALGCVQEELGDLEAAAASYRRALAIRSDYAEVHYNLGRVLAALGQLESATASYRQAIEINPGYAEAHHRLGDALHAQGALEQAMESYRRALEIHPDAWGAYHGLGNVQQDRGQLDEALLSYRQALEINPEHIETLNNLGTALKQLMRLEEAATIFRRALEIAPDFAEVHNNLGAVLRMLGCAEEAAESFVHALSIDPDFAEAHSNLGAVFKGLGRIDLAEESFRRALALKPDFGEAVYNLGIVEQEQGRLDDAVSSYRRALELIPNYVDAHNNLGVTLQELGKYEEAMVCYQRALVINPQHVNAHLNWGSLYKDIGRLTDAIASYRRGLNIKPDDTQLHDNLLFIHNYLADQPPAQLLADARRFGVIVAEKARPYTAWHAVPDPDRRLRVGLLSGDLCAHPVGFFLEGILAALAAASDRLEVVAYPTRVRRDVVSERIRAGCQRWQPVMGVSDERLARQIHDDAIDLLIDLSGHTAHNRLPVFAWKPAPVQVSWLGYFATTGVAAIDYLIADPWTLPESEEVNFTEKIWRLPETRLCFTPPDVSVDVGPLPACQQGHLTFGCFNNLTKMNDGVVALWARILAAVPNSRLFLKAHQVKEESVRQSIVSRFAAQGIEAGRLILEGPSPREEYLAAYQRVDIALDPFPYPGGTTTVESLWMGVPVLTLAGERFLERQGVGLLMNAGLPEWVAANADDYVARAVARASDLGRLAELRAGLRAQVLASPIFDAARFAKHFEAALRSMWQTWCKQQAI